VDPAGNIYFASGPYVFVLRPNGTKSIFAGGGFGGRFESGIPAVQARLGNITGVATDQSGSVYICDNGNKLLWRVLPDGTIFIIRTERLVAPGRITVNKSGLV